MCLVIYFAIMINMDMANRIDQMAIDLEKFVKRAEIWQLLFDECPLGVAVFNSSMKFFLINHAFTEMTGYTTDILGKDIKTILPERFRRSHRRSEKQYAEKPEKKTNRHGLTPFLLKSDDEEMPVDIDLSYIKYDSAIYYVAFIRRVL